MTREHTKPLDPPPTPDALRRMIDRELALPPRLVYVGLLLAALVMAAVIGALWLTEPLLPLRTQVAFALMVAVAISWAAYSTWVLTRRRVLFARHRIVAGRMAVAFTSWFVLGALVAAVTAGGPASYAAAATGLAMLGVAVAVLVRAHREVARLVERRATLERELGQASS